MHVYGPAHLHGPQAVSAPHSSRIAQHYPAAGASAGPDEVEISSLGQLLDQLSDVPDIRAGRVQQIRAAIADGSYETDARLSAALDGLLDEIG